VTAPSFAPRRRAALAASLAVLALAACGGSKSGTESAPQTQRAPAPPSGTTNANSTSANTLDEGDLKNSQYGRMEDMLARVPGLQVLRSDNGSFTLKIRGIQNFRGDGEPLVVIDGMQVRTGGIASTLGAIHPRDVTRVEVLKDAGSTAFYGSAGVNGVIVITTRRAR
jgi:TonB-dependent SusC/RagA subfamily outer membrane receptor